MRDSEDTYHRIDNGFVHLSVGSDLTEHFERIEPCLNALELDFLVDMSDSNTLDFDRLSVSRSGDFLALIVKSNILILHHAPVAPLESYNGRSTVHFQNLPCEGRHHPLERLVAGRKVGILRAVELVGRNDGIVGTNFEHVLCRLGWAAIDGEGVVGTVNGSPVGNIALEACFDFPVFD